MKKIREFLPDKCMIELLDTIEQYKEGWSDKHTFGAHLAMRTVAEWLNTETTAELEGVKPVHHECGLIEDGETFATDIDTCGFCEYVIDVSYRYCAHCGTKIDWSREE